MGHLHANLMSPAGTQLDHDQADGLPILLALGQRPVEHRLLLRAQAGDTTETMLVRF